MNASRAWCGCELKAKIMARLPHGQYISTLVSGAEVFPDDRVLVNQDAFNAIVKVKPKLHLSEPLSLREIASLYEWHKSVFVGSSGVDEQLGDARSTEPVTQALALEVQSIMDPWLYWCWDFLFVSRLRGLERLLRRDPESKRGAFVRVAISTRRNQFFFRPKIIVIPNPGEDLRQACFQALGFGDRADLGPSQ